MTISLRHCVREAQHGNHEAVLFLLREFEPLIRKYVKKYYVYYESLEEAISTADHAIVDCIFTFDLNKKDNQNDYRKNNVQRRLYTTPLNMKAIGNNVIGNASRKTSSNRISSPIFPITGRPRKKKHRNTAY